MGEPTVAEPRRLDAVMLLAGPRGRRMLLELATTIDAHTGDPYREDSLRRAVQLAAFGLDPALSPVPLTSFIGFAGGGGPADLPTVTPEEVAARLDAVDIGELTEELLLGALAAATGYAVYWDYPFAEEALAASAPVTAALVRFAAAVAASELAAWWTSPLDEGAQWAAQWQDAPFADPLGDSRSTLTAAMTVLQENEARERLARPDRASDAPLEHWRSTPPNIVPESTRALAGGVPLRLYCYEEGFKWLVVQARRLEAPQVLHTYEIDSAEAWAELCQRFPCDVTETVRNRWAMTTGRDGTWVLPDWAAVAERYDAVHLQVGAYLAASGTIIPVGENGASMIAGWDADETFWFTPRVRYVGEATLWVSTGDRPASVWRQVPAE